MAYSVCCLVKDGDYLHGCVAFNMWVHELAGGACAICAIRTNSTTQEVNYIIHTGELHVFIHDHNLFRR